MTLKAAALAASIIVATVGVAFADPAHLRIDLSLVKEAASRLK